MGDVRLFHLTGKSEAVDTPHPNPSPEEEGLKNRGGGGFVTVQCLLEQV